MTARLAFALLALALLPLLAGACAAPEAILEVRLTLPAGDPATPRFALAQVRRGQDGIFEAEWLGDDALDPLFLTQDPIDDLISIQTDDVDMPVALRVTFCESPTCDGELPRAPQAWFLFQQPFHAGERTEWVGAIDELTDDPAVQLVERCDIRGCVDAQLELDTYCDEDGRHRCE